MALSISMDDISAWLRADARRAGNPGNLLTRLGEWLDSAGLPLEAMTLELETLNPLMAGSALVWHREQSAAIETPRFHHPFGSGLVSSARPAMSGAGEQDSSASLKLVITFSDGSRHHLTIVASALDGFNETDIDRLRILAEMLAAPLEVLVLKQINRTLMTTYLGARTADQVLSGAIRRGMCDSVRAVLWYSDLRDFTAQSQRLSGDAVIALLNSHFERLAPPIKAFGGEVLKFMGDGLLAIFPIDAAGSEKRACAQAIKSVRAARAGMASLNAERRSQGKTPLAFGVALHIGEVMYGNIGAPDRLDFTVIGPTVNLASRLESLSKPLGCPVLISEPFKAASDEALISLGCHHLPNIADAIEIFTLREVDTAT